MLLAAVRADASFSVRDYGSRGDKSANDAPAIQAAIDAAAKTGGEVIVPAGNYLSGEIVLKSNVTLRLEAGATIWASSRPEDYSERKNGEGNRGYLFVAEGQENIGLVGDGKIEGIGQEELARRSDETRASMPKYRFGMIHLTDCKNVQLRDFGLYYSDAHSIVLNECEKVFVDGLHIINNFFRVNSDGIDLTSCKDAFISNCYIIAGDDCICPKTEKGLPLENLVVDNCILESVAGAFKLGTGSSGDFRDVKVSNCVIRNSGVGLGIFMKDGGTVERVSFSNISIETTRQDTPINSRLRNNIIPIFIDIEKRDANSPVGKVRDVSFSDIQVVSDNSVVIEGMAERSIENLTLRNIAFHVDEGFDFAERTKRAGGKVTFKDERRTLYVRQPTYIALAHINGLTLDNVRVLIDGEVFKKFGRSALALFDARNAIIRNIQREPAGFDGAQPMMTLNNCQQVLVADCLAPAGTPVFLGISGRETKVISLIGNELSGARDAVLANEEVSPGAVNLAARIEKSQ